MYKLIFADDESIVRSRIQTIINWEQEGFRLLGCCANGYELMDLVEKELPDLVILDINMPFITGLEAARQIRSSYPRIQIIFLTGYTEFSYAKQALELNALEYIVKPVDGQTLRRALSDARSQLDKSRQEIQRIALLEHYYRQNLQMLLEDLLQGLAEPEAIYKRAQAQGIDWTGETWFQAAALALDPLPEAGWEQSDRRAMLYALYNIAAELLEGESLGMASLRKEQVIVVGYENETARLEERMQELLQNVLDVAENQLGFTATAGISEPRQDCAKLPGLVAEARQTLELQTRCGGNRLYTAQDLHGHDTCHRTVWDAIAHIEKSYTNPELSAAEVSEYLHISPSYLRTLFKRQTGSTIIGYITKVRMEKARELLTKSNLKNSEVAEQVGYTDPHYFSYCFRRYYGMSPAEARTRLN